MKTTKDFLQMKENGEKITMITAYDYPSAKLSEKAGVDLILVGDSLGMVQLGYESTVFVTMDDMVVHTKAVKRGAKNTFIVADMPFATYHTSDETALKNALRLYQEAGAHGVKVEGPDVMDKIQLFTKTGIPVVAHLGLTPQQIGILGTYKVQGKEWEEAQKLIEDAKKCEENGAFALVLECVPRQLTKKIAKELSIPVIGIGAGVDADGQVLVYHDLIGYGVDRLAKFVKPYGNVQVEIISAIEQYIKDVKSTRFPEERHTYTMKDEIVDRLYGRGTNENNSFD
ncbi:3-methyl-2-oxobutanoate hydroxymethyltransferase [Fervidibacillus halotolerans]|uniref:3-methyl-2-oxobutanoate hydroxymethyltransferase n=1 Tax=Fervidibacillus halotolerans TaxID=2980027 RepID=A0A9E8RYE7_9BACI|nr:3-methyl-2-oxobutanoate hydroxymethyltransferase [Fervidibacillus halotolerans]WAA13740.1 3-methyl-2-oxobutanoate hydroxymethyltransferase [Fervidibacillus halotolerans]